MIVNTLRAVRWAFSTSGQTLIYLAGAAGVLTAMFAGWGFVADARWAVLVSLLAAAPYLIGPMGVQLLKINRDVALILLFVASLASGVNAWMFSFSISGLVLWAATFALFLGTLLIAISEMSFDRGRVRG